MSFLGTTRVTGMTDAVSVSTTLTVGLGQTTLVADLFALEAAGTLFNDGSLQPNAGTMNGTVVGNAAVCPWPALLLGVIPRAPRASKWR